MMQPPLLELKQLSFVYRTEPALRSIDWTVRPGEHWACLGLNGAGKTTLAQIVSKQLTRYSGGMQRGPALEAGGVAYVCFEQAKALCERDRKLDDSEFRADATDTGTTVRSLLLGRRPPGPAFEALVRRLRLGEVLDRGIRFVSTGELRKTLLASALLSDPALLILDSPLDGLDLALQEEMRRLLDELTRSATSVVLLCRQAEDIPRGFTHVLLLDQGRVADKGDRETVLSRPANREMLTPAMPPLAALPTAAARSYPVQSHGPLLALRSVTVRYGELTVFEDLDWTLDKGQHCCISGPNGCGKSTLLSLITGDSHKAYGQDITLFGRRRGSGESIWDIKQRYGQLDHRLHLEFPRGMRVLEAVISGFFDTLGLYDDWGDGHRQTARQWLRTLGLDDMATASFDRLSFGLQRMVLLARAMVKSPLILLLDEPTLGLDRPHRQVLLAAVDHIAAHSDTQVIFVSHTAGEMPRCINQRLVFKPSGDRFCLVEQNASAAPG